MNARLVVKRVASLALLIASAWCSSREAVAQLYWDNTNPMSTSGFGTAGGTWGTDALWSTSSTGVASSGTVTTGTADNVFFGTNTATYGLATGTVGINGSVNALALNIGSQSGAITLSGGTINLYGAIVQGSASTLTINSAINLAGSTNTRGLGNGNIVFGGAVNQAVAGTGILSTGTGTYTFQASSNAAVQINGGTVVVGASGLTLGAISFAGTVNPSRTFDLNGYSTTIGALSSGTTSTQTVTDNSAGSGTSTLTVQSDSGSGNNASSVIIQDGANKKIALTKAGTNGNGNLQLGAANTFTGNTLVTNGRITLNNNLAIQNSAIDTSGAGTFTLGTGSITTPTIGGLIGSKNLSAVITGSYGQMTALTLNTVSGQSLTYSGTITNGAAGMTLTKSGAGSQTLAATNTYTGATTVSAGTLEIASVGAINTSSGVSINGGHFKYNAATGLTAPITFTAGTLSGTGSIGTALTVGSSNILSPGNSPGSQAFTQGLTLASGGQYTWEINNWTGSAGANYDQLVVSGSPLNITATSGSTFRIAVTGLTGGNVSGPVPNFAPGTTGTSFAIATSSAGISGFDKTKFTIDTSAFTNNNTLATNAGFWVSTSSTSLLLNYAPSATYNLSAGATATAIRVGGTSTISATVTSSTASVTNPDQLAFTGLAVTGAGGLSATSGTVAPGSSTSGSVAFTGTSAGSYRFTPSITTGSNLNIGTAALAGSTASATVTVWNAAAANTLSGTINLGTVLKGTSLSQALLITNTAPNDGFSEKLDASFGTPTGNATASGSISLLASGSASTALSVGLDSLTAGGKSGSVQVNFTSNGAGTSGLGTLSLAPQTVSLEATVLDPATALLVGGTASGSNWSINLGEFNQGAGTSSPLSFGISNLAQMTGYTADLDLTNFSLTTNSGAILTTLSGTSFPTLAAGNTKSFSVWMSLATTGSFSNVYSLSFNSSKNGNSLGGTPQHVTLTVTGVIVVPEPGSLALALAGLTAAGFTLWKRRRG